MSDSREKTMRLTRIALLIAMNCISAYLIIPCPFPVAHCLADARRQPGRLPAAAERRSHHHAGLHRHRSHRRPRLHRRYGRSGQDVRPDRRLHLGLCRCGLPHVLGQGAGIQLQALFPGSRRHRHPRHLPRRRLAAQRHHGHALGSSHHERRHPVHSLGYRQEPLRCRSGTTAAGLGPQRHSGMTPAVNPFFIGIHFLVYLR